VILKRCPSYQCDERFLGAAVRLSVAAHQWLPHILAYSHLAPILVDNHLAPSNQESSYRPHPMSLPETPSCPAEDSDFQSVFNEAVKEYNKKTNGDITSDPLLVQLRSCTSVDGIRCVSPERRGSQSTSV
jgi:hypothetical protein